MNLQHKVSFVLMMLFAFSPLRIEAQTFAMHAVADQRVQALARSADWAELARYRGDNTQLATSRTPAPRVVFMGDSITDFWGRSVGEFFPGEPYVNRGISGQMTGQMLLRFRPDVIDLHPAVVVILAGTNDIGNGIALHTVEDNLTSMVELAIVHHIKVALASLLPVHDYVRADQSSNRPPAAIRELNDWMRDFTKQRGIAYLDYYAAMVDARGALRKDLSDDGLHPNAAGYAVMAPLAQRAIQSALASHR